MIAYKLLRRRSDGTLGPLFVGRDQVITIDDTLEARGDLPHPGLVYRPGFHCTEWPYAPHIKMRLKNGERRVWCEVSIWDYSIHRRPACQGGLWFTAWGMRVLGTLTDKQVEEINNAKKD